MLLSRRYLPALAGDVFESFSIWQASHITHMPYMAGDEFDRFPLPTRLSTPVTIRVQYRNTRAREVLGVTFRPLQETVVEMARDLLRRGFV